MRKIILSIALFSVFAFGDIFGKVDTVATTVFKVTNKNGSSKNINLRGEEFIVVSVRELGSDGRFYAVDRDGTVWLSGGISSGEEMGFTPSGKWSILHKKRYYTSKKYPDPAGSNNMNYSPFFTPWGHALHEGNIDYSSHGCIHVDKKDIPLLYNWAWVGMPVLITRHRYMQFARPDLRRIYKTNKKYTRKRR